MSRRVTLDGNGALLVRFPFDRALVDRIKSLPHRRWNAAERVWWVPETDVVALIDLLHDKGFDIDGPVRELYVSRGGTNSLRETAVAPPSGGMRDLFDAPENHDGATITGDFTVSRLNEAVRAAIEAAFPDTLWLVGEISGFNKSAHRRHVTFELAEHDEHGETVSRVGATMFQFTRQSIERELLQAGDPFRLEDEITVRLCVRVELYVPWGSYRVIVESLDVNYTLGEAARRREEIIRRLTADGLVGVNSELPLPALPLRVGLVTSLGSDAYNDVLRTLQESGFAFRVTAHGARVQGRSTVPSVLNALDWFRARAADFDVLLICRGGGSRADLVWFDSEALGRQVATFPLPVLVGIGHEQDRSVLDALARSVKTPTAAARWLVDTVRLALEHMEQSRQAILELAARRLADERRRRDDCARRLARGARTRLAHARSMLVQQRRRTAVGARASIATARERLALWQRWIPGRATARIARRRLELRATLQTLRQGALRRLDLARRQTATYGLSVGPRCSRLIAREVERLAARSSRLRLVDPRRVVERGFAVLRDDRGRVITDAQAAPAGGRVHAELKRGMLWLRSEGPNTEEGGD